jgi:hypothetical protein
MVRVWIRVPTVVWRIIRVSVPVAVVGTLKQPDDQSHLTDRVEQYRFLEATVRARAWNETSPAIRTGWMNLAEAYGRLAEQAEKASSADARIKPTTGGDHQEYHSDWGKEADIVGHTVGQAATTPTIIIS